MTAKDASSSSKVSNSELILGHKDRALVFIIVKSVKDFFSFCVLILEFRTPLSIVDKNDRVSFSCYRSNPSLSSSSSSVMSATDISSASSPVFLRSSLA